jgi:hypothetical protein
MQMTQDTASPQKNDNFNFSKESFNSGKKERNMDIASPTTANKILSLNVSPKSAFVVKSNINK